MTTRNLFWVIVPVALSAGVLWLSAQENTNQPEGVKVGDLAEKVQARERAVSQKESALVQFEQRLNTLQTTLDQDREQIKAREKTLEDERVKFEQEKISERDRVRELEKAREQEKVRDQQQQQQIQQLQQQQQQQQQEQARKQEEARKQNATLVLNDNLIRTYEAMTPAAASEALEELAKSNLDTAVALMGSMAPKKAAKIFDQLVNADPKLIATLSERIGKRKKEEDK